MEDYRVHTSDFRQLINKDERVVYFVPLSEIGSPSDFAELDLSGLNEKLADDHVEHGYLLSDLHYEFKLKDGVMGVEVSADASDYLNEVMLNDLSNAERIDGPLE